MPRPPFVKESVPRPAMETAVLAPVLNVFAAPENVMVPVASAPGPTLTPAPPVWVIALEML